MKHSPQNLELREIGLPLENQSMKSMQRGSAQGEAVTSKRKVASTLSLSRKWVTALIHLEKDSIGGGDGERNQSVLEIQARRG